MPDTPHRVKNLPTDDAGTAILDNEVEQMLLKEAITAVQSSEDELVSCFFARPKKYGKWRPIVSLKYLNKFIRYIKFRMTRIKDVKLWIKEGYFFASIDLTDAYFAIPLNKSAWKYIRFVWRNITYEFKVLMFGLGSSPRVFTKVLKAVVKFLRHAFAIMILSYLDDFLIQAPDYETCLLHTELAILVFQTLGFEVNYAKSTLVPTRQIEHLGFVWDSVAMTVSLPHVKVSKIVDLASRFLDNGGLTADELRSFLGRLESVRPVVEQAPLNYRSVQYLLRPLRRGHWRGQRFLPLTPDTRRDLEWWRSVFPTSIHLSAPLRRGSWTVDIMADASGNYGWGGHSSRGEHCQGEWFGQECHFHINKKEIIAGHKAIQGMMHKVDLVQLHLDNMTAVAFINRMGGTRSSPLCQAAMSLWHTVLSKQGWVKATWVPREGNQLSDLLSKSALQTWEFSLSPSVATVLWTRWFLPVVDVFASNQCHLLPDYYSWYRDPVALARDAFAVRRWPNRIFCFPPVPLLSMTLTKIREDKVMAIVILPEWRTAHWWDILSPMLLTDPFPLGFYRNVLIPTEGQKLPYLHPLVACLLSGNKTSLY